MGVSRWLLPALGYSVGLNFCSLMEWSQRASISLDVLIAIVVLNSTMAFGMASMFQVVQSLRVHSGSGARYLDIALAAGGLAFCLSVATELVHGLRFAERLGYHSAMALILAGGLSVVLNGLRANAFGSRVPNLLANALVFLALMWAQHRYRMQLREARNAAASAAFLLLSAATGLRIAERLLPARDSDWRAAASVLLPLVCVAAMSFTISDLTQRKLYFSGSFPGRFVFALHLPRLLARGEQREAGIATAKAPILVARRSEPPSARQVAAPAAGRQMGVQPADVVIVAVVDAARYDVFSQYAQRPESKLHDFWEQSCYAGVAHAPGSDTAGVLIPLLLRPGTKTEYWPDSVRRAGVATSVVLDAVIMDHMDRHLASGFSSLFDAAVRLSRSSDKPQKLESVATAVHKVMRGRGKRQLVWAHFYDVHEWTFATGTLPDRDVYAARVRFVGDAIAGIAAELRASGARMTLVVLGDHGEGVDHFSTRTHAEFLYEPLLRVPLMVWTNAHACAPSVTALKGGQPPSTLILGRLVLDELGIASDAPLPTVAEIAAAPVVMRAGIQDAVLRWPYKLIVSPWFRELYDLKADPQEQHDLIDAKPRVAAELGGMLPQ